MITLPYERLLNGPIDEIDAALCSGDMFHNLENIDAFCKMIARWENALKECEDIANGNDNA